MIRTKWHCMAITKRASWSGVAAEFVYDADFSAVSNRTTAPTREAKEENAAFWAATPSGAVKLSTIRADHFEVGKDYYLDFTPVES